MKMNLNGKRINYSRKGFGKPILFVHGWGGSIHSLNGLSQFFSTSHECILLDLPGFGSSDLPEPNWGSSEYAELIAQFIKKLNLRNLTFFGHSFGGSIGIIICANHPSLISYLILCNSAYKRTRIKSETASLIKRYIYSIPVLNKFGPFLRRLGYLLFFRNSDLYKFLHLESNFKKIISEDLTPLLSRIKTRTLILWGEADTQTPVSLGYELNTLIKKSDFTVFPNIKHNLPIKEPQLVAHAVNEFIQT